VVGEPPVPGSAAVPVADRERVERPSCVLVPEARPLLPAPFAPRLLAVLRLLVEELLVGAAVLLVAVLRRVRPRGGWSGLSLIAPI
jgi:hypothetical protein